MGKGRIRKAATLVGILAVLHSPTQAFLVFQPSSLTCFRYQATARRRIQCRLQENQPNDETDDGALFRALFEQQHSKKKGLDDDDSSTSPANYRLLQEYVNQTRGESSYRDLPPSTAVDETPSTLVYHLMTLFAQAEEEEDNVLGSDILKFTSSNRTCLSQVLTTTDYEFLVGCDAFDMVNFKYIHPTLAHVDVVVTRIEGIKGAGSTYYDEGVQTCKVCRSFRFVVTTTASSKSSREATLAVNQWRLVELERIGFGFHKPSDRALYDTDI